MYKIAPESPYSLLTDEETRAWYAYMKVHLRLRYEMNHQLRADHGLSLADYDILVALISDEHATLSITDLATRIGWERSRASHHVRRMKDRGLVSADIGPTDRRVTTVTLTRAGRATLASASAGHVALVRKTFFERLDHERMRELAEAFEAMYESLIKHGTLPRPADHP